MTYQPLYATVQDNQGYRRGTSSCRGEVNNVGVWINSYKGTVLRAEISYRDGKQIIGSKPDLRKIKKHSRKEITEQWENDVSKESKVFINLDLEENKAFEFVINGIKIENAQLKAIQQLQNFRFDQQLKMLEKLRDSGNFLEMTQKAEEIKQEIPMMGR